MGDRERHWVHKRGGGSNVFVPMCCIIMPTKALMTWVYGALECVAKHVLINQLLIGSNRGQYRHTVYINELLSIQNNFLYIYKYTENKMCLKHRMDRGGVDFGLSRSFNIIILIWKWCGINTKLRHFYSPQTYHASF